MLTFYELCKCTLRQLFISRSNSKYQCTIYELQPSPPFMQFNLYNLQMTLSLCLTVIINLRDFLQEIKTMCSQSEPNINFNIVFKVFWIERIKMLNFVHARFPLSEGWTLITPFCLECRLKQHRNINYAPSTHHTTHTHILVHAHLHKSYTHTLHFASTACRPSHCDKCPLYCRAKKHSGQ